MKTSTVNLTRKGTTFLFTCLLLLITQFLMATPILNCNNLNVSISCQTSLSGLPTPSMVSTDCGSVAAVRISFQDDRSGLAPCGSQGIIVRTWIAVDSCGDIATCNQLITITNNPPALNCDNLDVRAECSDDLNNVPKPTVSDDCTVVNNIALESVDDRSNLSPCGDFGTIIRTWTATDACGLTATCVQTITISNEAPVLICNNLDQTITCADGRGENDLPKPLVRDNCTPANEIALTFVDDYHGLDDCGDSGIFTRTWTATDRCGLTATCIQTITIINEAPVLTCNNLDVTIACDTPRGENDLPRPSVTDDCSMNDGLTLTWTDDESNLSGCTGFIRRTWTATDQCGLTSTCIQTITIVEENQGNNLLCQNIQIQSTNSQISISNIIAPNPIVKVFDPNWQLIFECSGDCPEMQSFPNLTAGEIYHTDIQFYDESWQFICEDKQDIEIIEGTEPCDTSICQGDVFLRTQAEMDAFCGCEVIEGDLYIGETGAGNFPDVDIDNLGQLNSLKVIEGSLVIGRTQLIDLSGLERLEKIGTTFTTVFNPKLTNYKGLGNLVCINDDLVAIQNPKLESFSGLDQLEKIADFIYIEGNTSLNSLEGLNQIVACGSFDLGFCPSITSLDGLDNLKYVERNFVVRQNEQLETTNGIEQLQRTGSELVFFSNPNLKRINGLDNFTNVGGSLVVQENQQLISILGLMNVQSANQLVIRENPNLSDCCAITHLVDADPGNGQVLDLIEIEQNLLFCNSSEEIIQNCQTPPPTCQNIQILTDNNQIVIQGLTAPNEIVKVFDKDFNIVYQCVANCEETQMTGTFPVGDYTIDLQLYDENWTLICAEQRGATVIAGNGNPCNIVGCETIAPVLANIPADMTVECDAVPSEPLNVTATDNCDTDVEIQFEETRSNGSCVDNYTLTRTWIATDDCGNSASGRHVITIVDSVDPVLANIPADETVSCDAIPSEPINIRATDNCDADVEIEFNEERIDGACQDSYVLIRTWTATDNCGNLAQGVQTISVVDNTAPVLSNVPADLTFNVNDGFDTTFPIATDNCAVNPTLTVEDAVNSSETEIIRTFTTTDNCGNTATAQQIITIIRDETDLCADIIITTSADAITFTNIDAPNSIVKLFDVNYQIIFDCTATCENELVIPIVGVGIYHTDVQFYDENWNFICRDRQDIEVEELLNCENNLCLNTESVFVNIISQEQIDCQTGVMEYCLAISVDSFVNYEILVNDVPYNGAITACQGNIYAYTYFTLPVKNRDSDYLLKNWDIDNRSFTTRFNNVQQLVDSMNVWDIRGNWFLNEELSIIEGGSAGQVYGALDIFNFETNNPAILDLNVNNSEDLVAINLLLGENTVTVKNQRNNCQEKFNIKISCLECDQSLPESSFQVANQNMVSSRVCENTFVIERIGALATTCEQTSRIAEYIKIQDASPPLFNNLPADLTINSEDELATNLPILTDNCDNAPVLEVLEVLNESESQITRTFTAIDNCGNLITAQQTITVIPDIDCNEVAISNNQQYLNISNLNAPIQIVKVFDDNYATVYECFAECGEMIDLTNLEVGRYHININFYDENWEPICERVETVELGSGQDRNTRLLPQDFALFPNPAETTAYLDLTRIQGQKVELELYNQFGQKIYQSVMEKVVQPQVKIDLVTYQNGLYLLKIKAKGKRPIAKKMLINRMY